MRSLKSLFLVSATRRPASPPSLEELDAAARSLSRMSETVRSASRAMLGLSVLASILLVMVLLMPDRGSTALLIPVDQRMYFDCIKDGCWNRTRTDTSFTEVARWTGSDEGLLRAGNPQIVGDTIPRGAQIRITSSMRGTR